MLRGWGRAEQEEREDEYLQDFRAVARTRGMVWTYSVRFRAAANLRCLVFGAGVSFWVGLKLV